MRWKQFQYLLRFPELALYAINESALPGLSGPGTALSGGGFDSRDDFDTWQKAAPVVMGDAGVFYEHISIGNALSRRSRLLAELALSDRRREPAGRQ